MNNLSRRALGVSAVGLLLLTVAPAGVALGRQPAGNAVDATYLDEIDVSHWQGAPAWRQVKNSGINFVIAKASEGDTLTDGQYKRNRKRAQKLGLPFTAYHFARPDKTANDAIIEADNFIAGAGLRGRNLVPVLDLEDSGGLGVRQLRRWVRAWLARVDARLGVKALIYTNPSFWRDRMGDTQWFANKGYRLWVAHWQVDQPSVPAGNWAGNGWTFWQYDNCGAVAGIGGCVDSDRFNGTDLSGLTIAANR